MKRIFAQIALCIVTTAMSAQVDSNSVANYFKSTLNGQTAKFQSNSTIAIKDIANVRSQIWSEWKKAVKQHPEEKLIALDELKERKSGKWTLPSELEPNANMPYYWGVNDAIEEDVKYPMFLYMHGSGNKHNEWENGIKFSLEYFHKPAAYFVPQIPNTGEYYRWAIQSKQWAWEKLLRLAFLDSHIDANRIYFFGISEGGYGSQRLAAFYADYLAGAGPMAGGEPLKNAPMENVANIAFSLRTGAEDHFFGRNLMTATAKSTAEMLAQAHPGLYKHFIEVIPGYGHGIDYRPTTPWLAEFTRNPHPEYFYWEDFEMYGRHRKGFYNLRVNQTSRNNDEERTCYEMKIDGNTIDLTVKNVTYKTTFFIQGIDMIFSKSYAEADKGNITIFLHEEQFNLKKPVTVIVNGKEVFKGKVKPTVKAMAESCALFYDPERLFPASIDIEIE